jgi:F-type H+-transporting ATPase subunit epsilon
VAEDGHAPTGVLEVTVVSPARQLYQGEARFVTAPAWDRLGGGRSLYGAARPDRLTVGQLGIFPRHAPLVAALGSGLLRIGLTGGQVTRFAVSGGFLKVGDNKVTILVDRAVPEGDVNVGDAQRELEETLAELQHPKSDEEFADLLDRRAWSETRINLASN